MYWDYQEIDSSLKTELHQGLGVSSQLSELLIRNGIDDLDKAQRFLYPRLAHLEDSYKITNLELVVTRLLKAAANKESIAIVGDYDVDGVTSTTLLVTILEMLEAKVQYFIPRRTEEGYGLTPAIIDRILSEAKPKLLVALDCGTNSINEAKLLKKKGIELVIIDHHQAKVDALPEALLVNPHVKDPEDAPWRNLCTVGLVFKLIHGIYKVLKDEDHPITHDTDIKEYLDLVAVGTVSDLVSLQGENRILTSFGLKRFKFNTRPGLQALCRVSGLTRDQELKPVDIAFKIGPRINASGRLADAALPVKMLLGSDFQQCASYASQLDVMNKERQDIERKVTVEAKSQIKAQVDSSDKLSLVAYHESWHPGVVGIVAGKLCKEYHRPTIILCREGDIVKGSGRSIPGINLVEALNECSDMLVSWGGHPMAAGVAMEATQVKAFCEAFEGTVAKQVQALSTPLEPTLQLTSKLELGEVTDDFVNELEVLQPFGMGNSEPVFMLPSVRLQSSPQVFSKSHFRFSLNNPMGLSLRGVAWSMADKLPPVGKALDMAVKVGWNEWNGRKFKQLQLLDWRVA